MATNPQFETTLHRLLSSAKW